MRSSFGIGAGVLGVAALVALVAGGYGVWRAQGSRTEALRRASVGAGDAWTSRAVWACDRRKLVVVEGVRPDEKMSRRKAEQVAALLQDLMRHCDAEITARMHTDERVTVSANGRVYEDYVIGGDLPIVPVSFGDPTERERRIWKAELDKLVKEGDALFHGDSLGTNGIACAMCHPNASNTHPETYPKFQTQLKKVVLLRDMVNWCIANPLEGAELAADDPRMLALEAYILASRTGTPLEAGKH